MRAAVHAVWLFLAAWGVVAMLLVVALVLGQRGYRVGRSRLLLEVGAGLGLGVWAAWLLVLWGVL